MIEPALRCIFLSNPQKPIVFIYRSFYITESNKGIIMQFTIIARDCGIDRNYPCNTYAEAEFLFNALSLAARHVEWWKGATLVTQYVNM